MSNPGSLMATSIINTEISEAKTKFQKLIEYLEGESTKWENFSGVILIQFSGHFLFSNYDYDKTNRKIIHLCSCFPGPYV